MQRFVVVVVGAAKPPTALLQLVQRLKGWSPAQCARVCIGAWAGGWRKVEAGAVLLSGHPSRPLLLQHLQRVGASRVLMHVCA